MAVIAFFRHKGERPTLRQLADYAFVGIVLLGVGNALVMWSEKTIPSGTAALIVASVPLWLNLLDGIRPGGTPFTLRVWIGTALGLLGVAFVARPEGSLSGAWASVAALQGACVLWAIGSLYAQNVKERLPILEAAAVEMLAACVVLFLESRALREDLSSFYRASSDAYLALGYLALFGSLIGFTAFALCLNELPAATVGTYAYVNPAVAVFLGRVFLKETLSSSLLIGACLILAAVILSSKRPQPRPLQSK